MKARNYAVHDPFILALGRDVPGFTELSSKQQARMAHFVWIAGSKCRAHDTFENYSSFDYLELQDAFGRNNFNNLNGRLGIFEVTPNWSKRDHVTKGYRLTPLAQRVKDNFLASNHPVANVLTLAARHGCVVPTLATTAMISMDGKQVRTLPAALASEDTDGRPASEWNGVALSNVVQVNLPAMLDLDLQIQMQLADPVANKHFEATTEKLEYRLESLRQLIQQANTTVAGPGKIAHRYVPCSSGRLFALGTSLQGAPRDVRNAALCGMYDYDIENCHFAIFAELAARNGFPCPTISHYLKHKAATREGIARRVGIPIEKAKTCLIMLMYGAPLNPYKDCAIPKKIEPYRARMLFKDTEFVAIANELADGRSLILSKWPNADGFIENDFGRRLSLRATPEAQLAHILQGIEAKALRACMRAYEGNLILPVHDGFVTREELDPRHIERTILEATGYRLEVSGGRISRPAILPHQNVLKAA
jgi:hypothetical protein